MTLSTGTRLGPYEILAPLGAGGMGEVYRARDTRLDREVAIKVLPERRAADAKALSRFEREAKAVAALSHPNILAIHDFGEDHGVRFAVTELLDGKTLRERIARERLTWRRAVEIGTAVADGLAAAHAKGIVHRDLKPENVFLTSSGLVKILDFGLARADLIPCEDVTSTPRVSMQTEAGTVLGTVGYMSPEQVRGESVDARSDIFSFGCLLYEMLSGQRAFVGESAGETLASILRDHPPEIAVLGVALPASLERVAARCLEKNRDERFQSVRDLAFHLREVSSGSAGTAVSSEGHGPAIESIAVLPFANASGDPQMEYLSDGLTESILYGLSQLPQLRVMARSAVFQHTGSDQNAQEIGRTLGVGAVVTGRVRQRGEALLISVELTDVENGWQMWGAQYRRQSSDILTTEVEIAKEISEKLRLRLTPDKQSLLARRRSENVEAYHLYLKGRFYWAKRTEDSLYKCLNYFRQAIEADPTYALAHAGLAEGYVPLAVYCHLAPKDAVPKANAAARRALEIDPELPEALAVLGAMKSYYEWDLSGSEQLLRAAVALDPSYPRARQALSETLTKMRRFGEAATEVHQALELDPLSLHTNAAVVMNYHFGQRDDEAIEHGRRAVDLDASFFPTRFYLGLAYQQKGQLAEAIAELQQARVLSSNSTLVTATLGGALAASGREAEARTILRELEEIGRRRYVPQTAVAAVHTSLGDEDQALSRLERAYEERCVWLMHAVTVDPRFDALRSKPRFQEIVRRVGPSSMST